MIGFIVRFLLTPAELWTRLVLGIFGGGKIFEYDAADPNPSLVPAPNFRMATDPEKSGMIIIMGPFYTRLDLTQVESVTEAMIKAREAMREAAANTDPANPRSKQREP